MPTGLLREGSRSSRSGSRVLLKQSVDVTITAQYPNDHNSIRNLFVENQIIADWKAAQSRAELIAKVPNARGFGERFQFAMDSINESVCRRWVVKGDMDPWTQISRMSDSARSERWIFTLGETRDADAPIV